MSTTVMSTHLDIGENAAFQTRRNSSSAGRVYEAGYGERREWQLAACTTTTTAFFSVASRHRNLSGPCCTGSARPTPDNRALATPPPGVPGARGERDSRGDKDHRLGGTKDGSSSSSNNNNNGGRQGSHRKLDRSLSDSEDRLNGNGRGVNSSRYKTELCRPFEESGHCKYGDKCQFAHGAHELRNLTRHPKYKTERCRTFHTIGFCPYGPRCHFIHNEDEQLATQRKNANNNAARFPSSSPSSSSSSSSSSSIQKPCALFLPANTTTSLLAHRPSNLCGLNSLGSSFESVSSSSSPGNLSPSHLDDTFPPIGTFSPSAVADIPSPHSSEVGHDSDSPTGTMFTFPASDAASIGSIMTPLNIQTQQMYNNVVDMAALARFAALNISQNQQNNQSAFPANLNQCHNRQHQRQQQHQHQQPSTAAFESDPVLSAATENNGWPAGPEMGLAFPPPSTSPHSAHSDDSMGSNGSLELTASSSSVDSAVQLVNSPHDLGRSMRLPIFNQLSES